MTRSPYLHLPISILLVEDETLNLELLATILTRRYPKAAFHCATDGLTGLKIFEALRPDIVITDINMPELSGVDMAAKMRATWPATRFIFLTGDSVDQTRRYTAGTGLQPEHLIVKPVGIQRLFALIDQCINEVAGSLPAQ